MSKTVTKATARMHEIMKSLSHSSSLHNSWHWGGRCEQAACVLVSKLDDYNFAEWSTNALESKRDVMA